MTRVKVCGITNLEDALVAVQAGADLLGFIFYEPSPRYVRPERVREIVSSVKCQVSSVKCQVSSARDQGSGVGDQGAGVREQGAGTTHHAPRTTFHVSRFTPHITCVGVFVNAPLETVIQLLDFCQLDAVQLHGEESPAFVSQFQGRAYKALRPRSVTEAEGLIQKYQPPAPPPHLPALLLDAYHPTLHGGTGQVTDWRMAALLARQYPLMLAGSLTPANVAEAVQVVQPWGVDVSSGVEQEKGRKDHQKVREFIERVKSVNR